MQYHTNATMTLWKENERLIEENHEFTREVAMLKDVPFSSSYILVFLVTPFLAKWELLATVLLLGRLLGKLTLYPHLSCNIWGGSDPLGFRYFWVPLFSVQRWVQFKDGCPASLIMPSEFQICLGMYDNATEVRLHFNLSSDWRA